MTDEILLSNAFANPHYAPYCLRRGCWRMVVVEPFYWRCRTCGSVCDLRTKAAEQQEEVERNQQAIRDEAKAENDR